MDELNTQAPVDAPQSGLEGSNIPAAAAAETASAQLAPSDNFVPAAPAPAVDPQPEAQDAAEQLDSEKDGLLMRLHAAIDDLEAKIGNGIHVFAHEVAALREYVKAIV